ncbi:MAG: hypothetical protein JSV63_01230 [Candidatus Aenigmatarchaeota archaeon]|nr:MAG: hypothetical protein JSV63_01230 [Candidatus Aenigmarchaeota archaeon]
MTEGHIAWYINCINGTNVSSSERRLTVDRTNPAITINLTSYEIFNITVPASTSEIVNISLIRNVISYNIFEELTQFVICNIWSQGVSRDTHTYFITEAFSVRVVAFYSPDGVHDFYVTCRDNAGNVGTSETITINKTSPKPLKINSPANTTYDYRTNLALNFEYYSPTFPSAYMAYFFSELSGASSGGNIITGNTTFTVPDDGNYELEIQFQDISLGIQNSTVYFSVDTTPSSNSITFEWPAGVIFSQSSVTVNISTDEDVGACLLSLDKGGNVSMSMTNNQSWYYSFIGLTEGLHELDVWCDDSGVWITENDSFRVLTTGFYIDIQQPLNKTYWNTDSFDVYVNTNLDVVDCELYLLFFGDSSPRGPFGMVEESSKVWSYNMTDVDEGSYSLTVGCTDTVGLYNSSTVQFTIREDECENNETGICTGAEQCVNSLCVDIICTGCTYADEHRCKPYECCSDDDCLETQKCVSEVCVEISCDCGYIEDNICFEYECCSNFDCGNNEECNTVTHECVQKNLTLLFPAAAIVGEEFRIVLVDQNNEPVEGAKIRIEYRSGIEESYTTDDAGVVTLIPKEAGQIIVKADLAGFDRKIATFDITPGIDIAAIILLILVAAAGLTGFFYWKTLPPLSLKKVVEGQNVLLRIKNRTDEYMDNVMILDSVPRGAFVTSGLMPRIEDMGNVSNLTWVATLSEDEEITINYQAVQTGENFFVRVGDDEYESGSAIVSILNRLLSKFKKEEETGY